MGDKIREAIIRLIMPDNWVKEISSKYDVSFKFIQCVLYGDYGGRGLFEVKGEKVKYVYYIHRKGREDSNSLAMIPTQC